MVCIYIYIYIYIQDVFTIQVLGYIIVNEYIQAHSDVYIERMESLPDRFESPTLDFSLNY